MKNLFKKKPKLEALEPCVFININPLGVQAVQLLTNSFFLSEEEAKSKLLPGQKTHKLYLYGTSDSSFDSNAHPEGGSI